MRTLSIVVPVFNEEEVLPAFHRRLSAALEQIEGCRAEVVFVDDGSLDRSPEILAALADEDPRVRVLTLTRNFGHQAAISAGLDHAAGEAVAILDADLQDPPELIPEFWGRWREGYHVVFGRRERRHGGLPKRIAYHVFYRMLRSLADIDIPLDSGDFALLDRRVVDSLKALPERTRFLRGLRSWVGLRQIGIDYARPDREMGESKYSLTKLFRLAFDGIVSFSTVPLRLALYGGLLISLAGFLAVVLVSYLRLRHAFDLPGWTSLLVAVVFMGGIQLITVGIVGEYIARIYAEVKSRPLYLVDTMRGFEAGEAAVTPTPTWRATSGRDSRTTPRSSPRADSGRTGSRGA